MKKEKVVIGLSGGVDSSVAAYLLKEQGYDVIGLFMINWHDTTGTLEGDCPWHDDRVFAELVARRLDIPFHVVDLSEQYRTRVVDYMFSEYEKGRTPNPDVLCNREIKFDVFLKEALKLGADHVATGHYCRRRDDITADVGNEITGSAANDSKNIAEDIAEKSSESLSESTETDSNNIAENTATSGRKIYHRLLAGADPNKDQSYFLCQLSQEQLSKALFPIGGLLKPEVRRIAEELKLATARRKDSQGICFVGKVDLPVFLQQKLSVKQGDIVEIAPDWSGYASLCAASQQTCAKGTSSDENTAKQTICDSAYLKKLASPHSYSPQDGVKIGTHQGAHFFTIGQRKGLGLGGRREPLFIIGTDVERNIVYVGEGYAHPGLFRPALFIRSDEMHWISPDRAIPVGGSASFQVRIRYRQPLQQATLHVEPEGGYIVFDEAQRGITPGQFAAWYSGEELVGSGVIDN